MATGTEFKSHGITENTPGNIVLGAGTIHAGLTCTAGTWNAAESVIAATSGGNTLAITPEVTDIEVDGANVKVADLAVKTGETATLETNIVEISPDVLKKVVIAKDGTDENATGYSVLESKPRIEKGDYIDNFGFVGKRIDGTPIIIIFEKALCNTGIEWSAEAKAAGVITATFECYAGIDSDLEHLPWKIYYPTPADEASMMSAQLETKAAKTASDAK